MVFQRFTQAMLDEFFDIHSISSEGRDYVALALKGASRKTQGGTRNATSNNPCPKMGTSLSAESNTVEARAILNCAFDPDVIAYSVQPPTLDLDYVNPDGRRIRTKTTPDLMVLRRSSGLCIEEWKTADQRLRLPETRPGRYVAENGVVSSPSAQDSARKLGGTYAVRFADEIPECRTLNQRWLVTYLGAKATNLHEPIAHLVTDYFQQHAYASVDEILELEGVNLELLHWCLATGRLTFDWDRVELRKQDCLIFRDENAYRAHQIATGDVTKLRSDVALPRFPHITSQIVPGGTIIADGMRYTIQFVGNTSVVGIGERGELLDATWKLLGHLNQRGLLSIDGRCASDDSQQYANPLKRATESQIQGAIRRREILEKHRAGVAIDDIPGTSLRSISRWAAKEREAIAAGLPPIAGLIDSTPSRGFHGPHIDDGLSETINSEISEGLRKKTKPSKNQLYFHIKKRIEAAGSTMISQPAFYARAKKLESIHNIRASQGHKVSYQEEPVYWQLEHTTPIHCQRPFELVHIDHTLLDLRPISMISGQSRTRVWLTLIMDGYSRRVLGFWLTYRPPSTFSTLMALYDMFKRFGRIPDTIITDWGSDFRSKAMKLAMNALGIRQLFRPKSAARYGAVLERIFGSVHTRLINNLAGNTKATKQVRAMSRAVDPKLHAGLFLYNIYDGLEEFFFDIYDGQAHPAWLRSPRDVFQDGLITGGARSHMLVNVNDILPILLPNAARGTRTVDDRRGVVVNYERFGSRSLADRTLRGKKILVKLVPFDPGRVLAHIGGEWQFIQSKFSDEFANLPPALLRTAYEDYLMDHRFVEADRVRASGDLTKLIEDMNEIALQNKNFADDPTFKKSYEKAFTLSPDADVSAAGDGASGADHQRIAEMAAQALRAAQESSYGEILR